MEGYYYTYILQSEKNGKNYAGYTKDLNLRFEQHQNGEVKATKYWRHAQRVFHRVDPVK
jgi:putative endonuclease